jgi:hypothetical protein
MPGAAEFGVVVSGVEPGTAGAGVALGAGVSVGLAPGEAGAGIAPVSGVAGAGVWGVAALGLAGAGAAMAGKVALAFTLLAPAEAAALLANRPLARSAGEAFR